MVATVGVRASGADQIASLQAKAATISHQLVLEQLKIDSDRQEVAVDGQRVADDQAAIAQAHQQIAADANRISTLRRQVGAQAVMAYMNAGAREANADSDLFSGGSDQAQAATEYTSIAVGDITTSMDRLRTAKASLAADQAQLIAHEQADRSAQAAQSAALGSAEAAASQMEAVQAQVTGELAAAVADAQAAQAAQAAAAVRSVTSSTTVPGRAQAPTTTQSPAATSPVTTTTAPNSSGGGGGGGGQNLTDPPLNAYLTCVVQVESGGNYGAVSPGGQYMGAFQFSQATWNSAAQAAGLSFLVGVPPNEASKAAQDTVAVTLYALDGQQPWTGDRC